MIKYDSRCLNLDKTEAHFCVTRDIYSSLGVELVFNRL